jgi:hypothetical protein
MEDDSALGYERLPAPSEWTRIYLGFVYRRVEVCFEVARGLEIFIAGFAAVVGLGLAVVLLQAVFVGEDPSTAGTVPVLVLVVFVKIIPVMEVAAAILAIGVSRALNVVFFEAERTVKVLVARIAVVVHGGVSHVLEIGLPVREFPLARSTVRKRIVGHVYEFV